MSDGIRSAECYIAMFVEIGDEMTGFPTEQRVVACVQAFALGDAMGKMTEGLRQADWKW